MWCLLTSGCNSLGVFWMLGTHVIHMCCMLWLRADPFSLITLDPGCIFAAFHNGRGGSMPGLVAQMWWSWLDVVKSLRRLGRKTLVYFYIQTLHWNDVSKIVVFYIKDHLDLYNMLERADLPPLLSPNMSSIRSHLVITGVWELSTTQLHTKNKDLVCGAWSFFYVYTVQYRLVKTFSIRNYSTITVR